LNTESLRANPIILQNKTNKKQTKVIII